MAGPEHIGEIVKHPAATGQEAGQQVPQHVQVGAGQIFLGQTAGLQLAGARLQLPVGGPVDAADCQGQLAVGEGAPVQLGAFQGPFGADAQQILGLALGQIRIQGQPLQTGPKAAIGGLVIGYYVGRRRTYMAITAGLSGGEKIITGPYSAVSRELEPGDKIRQSNGSRGSGRRAR